MKKINCDQIISIREMTKEEVVSYKADIKRNAIEEIDFEVWVLGGKLSGNKEQRFIARNWCLYQWTKFDVKASMKASKLNDEELFQELFKLTEKDQYEKRNK